MNNTDNLDETRLPKWLAFYRSINERVISEADYDYAQYEWRTFQISTLGAYHDLYMETDVIFLTDVFENFRNICLRIYGLDPAPFYTSMGLAW